MFRYRHLKGTGESRNQGVYILFTPC